jgi:hypothetical protein
MVDQPALQSRRDGRRSHHGAHGKDRLNDRLMPTWKAEEQQRLSGNENGAAGEPLDDAADADPGEVGRDRHRRG